jgi:cell division protein FtsB
MRKLILFLVVLLVYLQYRLWFGDGGLLELWNIHQDVEAQRAENARLHERNEALNAQVLDLKQGLDAIEERAREDMGMVKQGEIFYQTVEP